MAQRKKKKASRYGFASGNKEVQQKKKGIDQKNLIGDPSRKRVLKRALRKQAWLEEPKLPRGNYLP